MIINKPYGYYNKCPEKQQQQKYTTLNILHFYFK